MKWTLLLAAVLCLVALAAADAAIAPRQTIGYRQQAASLGPDAITIPQMLSYQGKLTDTLGQPVADTTYSVAFRLYIVPSGGSPFWNETQNVQTRSGIFSVLLGSVTPIGSVPDAGAAYLGMAVGWGLELAPRLRIASAAYSYLAARAANSDLLQGKDTTAFDARYVNEGQANSVSSAMIVNGTIVASDLGQMGASSGQVMKWTGSGWAPRNDSVGGGGGGTVTSVSQSTGITCSPNPITTTGTVGFDQTYGDGRYVNATGDSMTGALRVGAQLRVHDKAALGYSCYNNGSAAFCAGYGNSAGGDRASITGGEDNSAGGKYAHVSGGSENQASSIWSTIGGGNVNEATDTAATVAGGQENRANAAWSTVGGGYGNAAETTYATVAGGLSNAATGYAATVGGGIGNNVASDYATVGGGYFNDATGSHATVGGGRYNVASGLYATVPGGYRCAASEFGSFAAGSYAKARGAGSYVWSDSGGLGDSVSNATDNRWAARARGGVYFYTNLGMTTGSYLSAGGSSWNSVSDSMTKENFRPVDKKALLEALARMRVRDYNLKSQDASIRHIGPVAQDFHNSFGFGESNTAINMEDADGVLMAAVQALYEDNKALHAEVEALKADLAGRQ